MSAHSPTPADPLAPATPADSQGAIIARLRAAGCVFAEDEAALLISAANTPADLAAMVDRRVAGLPLEQVIGWAEFCGLRVSVAPGVFVPRRRSEFLVGQGVAVARLARTQAAHRQLKQADPGRRTVVVDLCCGSGAVGIAVTAALTGADLHAVDIDPIAVRCARANVTARGGAVYQGDLCEPLPARLRGTVDLMIANAPYVPTSEIGLLPAEARLHEPLVALDGGQDGVGIQRRIAAAAPDWLAPAGRLLIETSDRQAPLTVAATTASGLVAEVVRSDELAATVVIGSRPGAPAALQA
jgi:release factor glutamine methyltransferase